MARKGYDNSAYHEAKAKLPVPDGVHCIICGAPLPEYRRKYCSFECSQWYMGGPILSWQHTKTLALRRANHTCQECGRPKDGEFVDLEVHHVKPIHEGGAEFDVNNCIALCVKCHRAKHNRRAHRAIGNATLEMYNGGGLRSVDF